VLLGVFRRLSLQQGSAIGRVLSGPDNVPQVRRLRAAKGNHGSRVIRTINLPMTATKDGRKYIHQRFTALAREVMCDEVEKRSIKLKKKRMGVTVYVGPIGVS
jgi:hypothetical protein